MAALLPRGAGRSFYQVSNGHTLVSSLPTTPVEDISTLALPSPAIDRKVSSDSKSSTNTVQRHSYRGQNENDPFVESPRSYSSHRLSPEHLSLRKSSNKLSRDTSWSTVIREVSDGSSLPALCSTAFNAEDLDLDAEDKREYDEQSFPSTIYTSTVNRLPVSGEVLSQHQQSMNAEPAVRRVTEQGNVEQRSCPIQPRPLRRWMSKLRRNHTTTKRETSSDAPGPTPDARPLSPIISTSHRRQRSSPSVNTSFFSVIRTTPSGGPDHSSRSMVRRNGASPYRRSLARSSENSNRPVRVSEDNRSVRMSPFYDEAVWKRAAQRRRILEELISSEESYIADMKILVNVSPTPLYDPGGGSGVNRADPEQVYLALLDSVPALSCQTRNSIHRNVIEILALHEELLGELHRAIPQSEINQDQTLWRPPAQSRRRSQINQPSSSRGTKGRGNARRKVRRSNDADGTNAAASIELIAEPAVAGEVAQVFTRLMKRFLAYEEYGAKYEMMVQDVASTHKSIPTWHAYERGIEALANSLTSVNKDGSPRRKGLTFEDLIIKPIQRVCRYPLLFAALLKATPVYDCPESHADLEKVLYRLREVTAEINKATHDSQTRDQIEKTWLLQDKLVFVDELQDPTATLRQFGRVILCGALHAAWQTRTDVRGTFMACILFRSYLVLATANYTNHTFTVVASIGLDSLKQELSDNGKNLQCHTAFTWKITFELEYRMYEIILSACSAKEEAAWTSALRARSVAEASEAEGRPCKPFNMFSSLSLDIKPCGTVFGQPGSIARRLSIHRATTLGAKSGIAQVVIKNTHALRDGYESQQLSSSPINRTHSLLSTARVPVLVPRRADRIRLENALADLWSRDTIPFPGMGNKRGDNLIRTSASSMMRKLSIASLTTSFSKRSTSYASVARHERDHPGNSPVLDVMSRSVVPNRTSSKNHDGVRTMQPAAQNTPEPTSSSSQPVPKAAGAVAPPQNIHAPDNIVTFASPGIGLSKSSKEQRPPKPRGKKSLARTLSVDGVRKLFR